VSLIFAVNLFMLTSYHQPFSKHKANIGAWSTVSVKEYILAGEAWQLYF